MLFLNCLYSWSLLCRCFVNLPVSVNVCPYVCIQSWVERAGRQALLSATLDLSELFHPDTFLNALRQEAARYSNPSCL